MLPAAGSTVDDPENGNAANAVSAISRRRSSNEMPMDSVNMMTAGVDSETEDMSRSNQATRHCHRPRPQLGHNGWIWTGPRANTTTQHRTAQARLDLPPPRPTRSTGHPAVAGRRRRAQFAAITC